MLRGMGARYQHERQALAADELHMQAIFICTYVWAWQLAKKLGEEQSCAFSFGKGERKQCSFCQTNDSVKCGFLG